MLSLHLTELMTKISQKPKQKNGFQFHIGVASYVELLGYFVWEIFCSGSISHEVSHERLDTLWEGQKNIQQLQWKMCLKIVTAAATIELL